MTTLTSQLITLFCSDCGKKRPFRFDRIETGRFVHRCVICTGEHSTHVAAGSLRQAPLSLFEKLHWIVLRDFTRYEVANTDDERFFKIRFTVDGMDDYEVHYMDYRPVEIHHRFKIMTQGHTFYPWLNGNGRQWPEGDVERWTIQDLKK